MQAGFGAALKEWRGLRRLSQMELGLGAGVSARHISFLETGRARPSRGMILRLCEALQVPGAGRDQMLAAAGLARFGGVAAAAEAQLQPLWDATARMLAGHMPYPAMALDRHWKIVKMNPAAGALLAGAGVAEGDSVLEALLENAVLRDALVNRVEVEQHMLSRLRAEQVYFGQDAVLEAAIARLQDRGLDALEAPTEAVIPARYRLGDKVCSFFSTITQFGSTTDVALSELKIEMFFPADAQTRAIFEGDQAR